MCAYHSTKCQVIRLDEQAMCELDVEVALQKACPEPSDSNSGFSPRNWANSLVTEQGIALYQSIASI